MPTHVALLRAINVGGHNKVPMAELRELVESLGHQDVATYIQSGNVVFTSKRTDAQALASELDEAVRGRFGCDPASVVVSCAELAKIAEASPYADETNPKAVHVVFFGRPVPEAAVARLARAQEAAGAAGSPDTGVAAGSAIYLRTPDGIGTSKLAADLGRATRGERAEGTARNWATVTKLRELCTA